MGTSPNGGSSPWGVYTQWRRSFISTELRGYVLDGVLSVGRFFPNRLGISKLTVVALVSIGRLFAPQAEEQGRQDEDLLTRPDCRREILVMATATLAQHVLFHTGAAYRVRRAARQSLPESLYSVMDWGW